MPSKPSTRSAALRLSPRSGRERWEPMSTPSSAAPASAPPSAGSGSRALRPTERTLTGRPSAARRRNASATGLLNRFAVQITTRSKGSPPGSAIERPRRDAFRKLEEAAHHRVLAVLGRKPPPVFRQRRAQLPVCEHAPERRSESFAVARGDEKARLAVGKEVARAADGSGDDRRPCRERLEGDERKAFGVRRHHKRVGGAEQLPCVEALAGKDDAVADATALGRGGSRGDRVRNRRARSVAVLLEGRGYPRTASYDW